MSHREFQDEEGRAWEVWDVRPSNAEPLTMSGVVGANHAGPEPHVRRLALYNLPAEFRGGWLAFKSDGESRRLAPIPQRWNAMGDQDLASLVRTAKPISRVTPRV